ncbi:hypothetical protein [Amycolatopsis speibonae]|uniref:Uncharacterized protein n=1 Tax=Amycolatopsis speibonae TaxID=1450224 RepID=A0ABV7P9Q3_9PSEU
MADFWLIFDARGGLDDTRRAKTTARSLLMTDKPILAQALRRWITTIFIVVTALLGVQGVAAAGTDDYPAPWRSAAQDSLLDSWGYYNRECTSFVAEASG